MNMSKSESKIIKFVAGFDVHYGYERKNRHKTPLHDWQALEPFLRFVEDFKPDVFIAGGDWLDCGAVSHHNHNKPGKTEGLRIADDAKELRSLVLDRIEAASPKRIYLKANHEAWLDDISEAIPGLEGLLDVEKLLGLDKWSVVQQGDYFKLGKLVFIHGDQIRASEYAAKNAVLAYEQNIRMGHLHTLQVYTKTSAMHIEQGRTGMVVPCLCSKRPSYLNESPNKWLQGFLYGYMQQDGNFNDYPVIITKGQCVVNGKQYSAKVL
jgi:hypothetical protein